MPPESPRDTREVGPSVTAHGISASSTAPVPDVQSNPEATHQEAYIQEPRLDDGEQTRLLRNTVDRSLSDDELQQQQSEMYGSQSYGTMAIQPGAGAQENGRYPLGHDGQMDCHAETLWGRAEEYAESLLGESITDGLLGRPKKRGTTHTLASQAGVKSERRMSVS